MPVKLQQVIEHVHAMDPDIDRHRVAAMVRETIGALGLCVSASNDEVYNPAPRPTVPEQRNVRWSGSRNGRQYRR